jgi:minor extracellular serine protease Vpr
VHRQGAGMLNIYNAVKATTRITPGKLSLGEMQAGPVTKTLTIENRGARQVTYTLSSVGGITTGPDTFNVQLFVAPGAVTFSAPTVTVAAGASADVNVTVAPPTTQNKFIFGGWVVATPDNGDPALRVPFAGFTGDYQSIQVLAPTANGFPWLARLSSGSFFKQTTTATYTMAGDDVPYILLHLDHQSAALQVTVTDAVSGRDYHFADNERYLGRNSTATGFFAISWNGVTATNGGHLASVPNGEYILTLRVLKALGDPLNPADWETFAAPHVIVARP